MEGLHDEAIKALGAHLAGVDVLLLSHVNRHFYCLLSSSDVWMDRVPFRSYRPPEPPLVMPRCPEKRAYATYRCLLSQPVLEPPRVVSHGSVRRTYEQKTLAIRFCLLPEFVQGATKTGVDMFCSSNKQLTVRLEPGRWYHLVWVIDEHEETIYFNGKLLAANVPATGDFLYLWDGELHSTFLGFSSPSTSKLGFRYSFALHGLIDSFARWPQRLPDDEILMLAQGKPARTSPYFGYTCLSPKWAPWVFSSRPQENVGTIISK
ncbi:hypothetical protein Poli38472_004438 [Pythium oligandrum]|uniref:F-box domain-containing protein n=1 Tax=Pythium oligandrum TaxID=41045 RepID=A0A8K1FFV8_PYTOL|nr:hypothetical protein Poli38472_004438 [Pythium oligandrum]|eukprot:TMW59369.1 hypothetical protein Poli38472_004438 [Pythium oligandrum]